MRLRPQSVLVVPLIIILSIMHLTIDNAYSNNNIIKIKQIRLSGFEKVPKLEVLNKVRFKKQAGFYILDLQSLKTALISHPLIAAYKIKRRNAHLIVTVTEKRIGLTVGLISRKGMQLYVFDNSLRMLAKNKIYTYRPIVFLYKKNMASQKEKMKPLLLKVFKLLQLIEKKMPNLYNELNEVYIQLHSGYVKAQIVLNKRQTKFSCILNETSFRKIWLLCGYLDYINYYPERVDMKSNRVILK